MDKNLKIPSPWAQLGLLLGLGCGALVATSVITALVLLGKEGTAVLRQHIDLEDPSFIGTLKILQAISTILLFGMPAYFYAKFTFRQRPLHYLGMRIPPKRGFYLLGVLLLFVSFPLEGWLGQINRAATLPHWAMKLEQDSDRQIMAFLKTDSAMGVLVNLVVIALLPAIFEELCFRGAFQRILIHCFRSPWAGIVVASFFFSAFHGQFQGFLPRMFLGMLLGALYWYSGSIWTSVLAHFFTNGIQVVAVTVYPDFASKDPTVPPYAAIISAILVLALLYAIRRMSTVTYAGEFTDNEPFKDYLL
jgi:membrane protease YdiL (CAAX protease family)